MRPNRISQLTDLTDLQRAVVELEQQIADDRFHQVLDALPDLVTVQRSVTGDDGEVVDFVVEFINHPDLPVGTRLRRELIGASLLEMLPELAGTDVFDAMVTAATTQRPSAIVETPVTVTVPGETEPRFASMQVTPFRDGVIVVVGDVTERRRHLDELERTNQELTAAQQLARIGIWRVDLRDARLVLSDEAARIIGQAAEGEQPWSPGMLLDLLEPTERSRVAALIGAAGSGVFSTEARIARADGAARTVSLFGQVVGDDEPGGPAVWGTVQDLTEQRLQELALAESEVRLARERATVSMLQEAILPTLPRSDVVDVGATYLTAREESLVGGDWYDAFLLGPGQLVIAVGDVAGHGLPAAALMGQLRNALRGLCYGDHPADEALAALNRMVLDGDEELATCALGRLALDTGDLRWASAGHPPPLLLEPRRGARFLTGPVAPPLGVRWPGPEVNLEVVEAGSLLVWYSDGLIERRGESLDVGMARLAARAEALVGADSAQEISARLADSMVADADLEDDLCVLVVRVPERPPPVAG